MILDDMRPPPAGRMSDDGGSAHPTSSRVHDVTVVAALDRMMSERAARTGPFAVAPQGPR
jgi:hypothetical protein